MYKELKDYAEFISICTSKSLLIQHNFRQESENSDKYYELNAIDGAMRYECHLNSIDTPDDITDFEANYLSDSNSPLILKDEYGNNIIAPTIEDVMGFYPTKQMYVNTVTAGVVNIFDVEVTTERLINGGEYWIYEDHVPNVHKDDVVDFYIVDKNDVLGLFATYGLTVGDDILYLTNFVNNDIVKKGNPADGYHSQLYEGIKGANTVVAGLFYRVIVDSAGTQDYDFLWRVYYYE